MKPAGLERAQGLFSAHYQKDATDPRWRDDKGMQDNLAFMKKYLPNIDTADSGSHAGYNVAQTLAQVLRQCGDELTRENFMRQAADLRDLELPMLLPGIKVNTSPEQFLPGEADAAGQVRRRRPGAVRRRARRDMRSEVINS
jgi:branched-chain amino acid transport system substrate-binding protein